METKMVAIRWCAKQWICLTVWIFVLFFEKKNRHPSREDEIQQPYMNQYILCFNSLSLLVSVSATTPRTGTNHDRMISLLPKFLLIGLLFTLLKLLTSNAEVQLQEKIDEYHVCLIFIIAICDVVLKDFRIYFIETFNFCKRHGLKRVCVLVLVMTLISFLILGIWYLCVTGLFYGLDTLRILNNVPFKSIHSVDIPRTFQDAIQKRLCSERNISFAMHSEGKEYLIPETDCTKTDKIADWNVTPITYKVMKLEDKELKCDYSVTMSEFRVRNMEFVWKFNDVLLNNKYRYISKLDSTLIIYSVNENDFGIYTCWLKTTTIYSDFINVVSLEIAIFTLEPLPATLSRVRAPIGSLIEMEYPSAEFHRNVHHVQWTFTHILQGKPLKASKKILPHLSGCTLFTNIFRSLIYCQFLKNSPCFRVPYLGPYYLDNSYFISTLVSCVDPNFFGMHSLQINRNVYNKETLESEYVSEGTNAFFLIEPTSPINLLVWGSWFDINNETVTVETDDNDINMHKTYISDKYEYVSESAAIILLFRLLVEGVICFILIEGCGRYLQYFWNTIKHIIIIPVKNRILKQTPCLKQICLKRHDVMILCSDEDGDTAVGDCVADSLETLALKPCLAHRDLTHLGNIRKNTVYLNAMNESSKIVIVISETFLQDNYLLNFIFHSMIPDLITDKNLSVRDMLVLEIDCNSRPEVEQAIPGAEIIQGTLQKKAHIETQIMYWAVKTFPVSIHLQMKVVFRKILSLVLE